MIKCFFFLLIFSVLCSRLVIAQSHNDLIEPLSMPFEGSGIPVAYQQDLEGNVIQEVSSLDHQVLPKNFSSEISSTRNSGAFDQFTLAYGSKAPDTLYYYNTKENKLEPKFVATFTGDKHGTWLYDWKSFYWTPIFGKKYRGTKVIVDKKTLKSDFFKIKNDFFGGYEINKFYMSNNGVFISSVNAINLIIKPNEALKQKDLKSKEKERIEELLGKLKEDDNEVMFIGEMK